MDYGWHIRKAVDFMECRLTSPVDLEEVADRANFSRFHFHRIFQQITGLTLKTYLRKRRLSEAARKLIFTDKRISDIATLYQFKNQTSFTRAFKKEFSVTPGRLRRLNLPFPYYSSWEMLFHKSVNRGVKMDAKIVTLDEKKIVGMKITTTAKTNQIPHLWTEFNPRCGEIKSIARVAYGICPFVAKADFSEESPFEYIAGLEVENFDEIPKGMVTYVIPAAKYAVFTHVGTLDTLNHTYFKIHTEWFPESEYEVDYKPEFELYDERFKFGEADSELDVYIPIK